MYVDIYIGPMGLDVLYPRLAWMFSTGLIGKIGPTPKLQSKYPRVVFHQRTFTKIRSDVPQYSLDGGYKTLAPARLLHSSIWRNCIFVQYCIAIAYDNLHLI
jgi:hypothetical protein